MRIQFDFQECVCVGLVSGGGFTSCSCPCRSWWSGGARWWRSSGSTARWRKSCTWSSATSAWSCAGVRPTKTHRSPSSGPQTLPLSLCSLPKPAPCSLQDFYTFLSWIMAGFKEGEKRHRLHLGIKCLGYHWINFTCTHYEFKHQIPLYLLFHCWSKGCFCQEHQIIPLLPCLLCSVLMFSPLQG